MEENTASSAFLSLREGEVAQIFQWIKAGESASIIGVSNVGKSVLFQHLLDPAVQARYLADLPQRFIFLRINLHSLANFANRSVYSLILEQLELLDGEVERPVLTKATIEEIGRYHAALLEADKEDELKIQRFFKLAVRACLQDPTCRLVLMFDQFDRLYQYGEDALFYNLRALRDAYKNRILYLVFTRHSLPELLAQIEERDDHPDASAAAESAFPVVPGGAAQSREELYELLQTNWVYLQPYSSQDADCLLRGLAEQNGRADEPALDARLVEITGGHAGLLRICYFHAFQNDAEIFMKPERLPEILTVETIAEECEKLWFSLSDEERTALAARLNKSVPPPANRVADHLEKKGLVTKAGTLFSPLFEQFLIKQQKRMDRPVYLDEKRHIIYIYGQPREPLSKSEYLVFKALYDRENTLISVEELSQACWPDEEFDKVHTPQALTAMIYRIRLKLRLKEDNGLLQSKHKQGYILNNQPDENQEPGGQGDGRKSP